MRRLILIAALSATVVFAKPKPETYKETEDFQFSRSSSDDGTKSGFYGAQRGNMGGNYERAHNMDNLAQHQMSGLVRQVDGELGEGVKTRTGSVYTAANSRGIYGSGKYDLSNLQGRNFAEGTSFGSSHSQSLSALSSQNSRNSGQAYGGMESSTGISSSRHSQDANYRGYQSSHHGNQRQIDNLQAVDTSQGLGAYETGYNTNYHTRYGSHGRSEFDQSSTNFLGSSGHDANSQARYITTPVRVVVRPGGRVAIPISTPTYTVSQNALSEASGVNSDAEVINQPSPTNKAKHYEASYSYRKQWEKHHSIPGDVSIVVPTENPFPKNSELYEDAQLQQSSKNQLQNINSQALHSSNTNSNQRAYVKSGSSHSRFQAGYNTQQGQSGFESLQNQAGFDAQHGNSGLSPVHRQSGESSIQSQAGSTSQSGLSSLQSQAGSTSQSGLSSQQSQSDSTSQQSHLGFNSQQSRASSATGVNSFGHNALTSGSAADLTNAAGDINSKPKSYSSSYSYHKSWERQGDPYVIKPVGPIYDAQASERLTAASSNSAAYTSRQYGSHSRQPHQSYSADCDDQGHIRVARSYNPDQELEQVQNQWEDLGQQTLSKLEDLGQQTQNQWDQLQQLGQETQNQWDNLQQLGQETQKNQWDNLQQLGQQSQNQFDNLQQLGQQTQDKWENLEDLGQQTHSDPEQRQNEKIEDFSQLSQKQDILTNFEQQANNQNENLDILNQHVQNETPLTNFEQQANDQNEKLDILNQHVQKENQLSNFEQQANNQHENLEKIRQNSQKEEVLTNFEQPSSNQNENLDIFSQQAQTGESITNFEQQANTQNEKLPNWDNNNNWVQSNIPSNTDQQFLPVNEANNNNRDLFNQNQENEWFQSVASVDKNRDTNDFMKPISPWTDHSDSSVQPQNLFPLPSSNTEYLNDKHDFWHTNKFNFNSQFDNNFSQSSISTSDTGNPLQGLWEKIDNIAGEVTATEGKSDDKNIFSHVYSYDNSQNENDKHMQNGYNSNYVPVHTNVDLVNTNIDIESTEKQLGHHKLFDEQTDRHTISTTVLPILASSDSSTFIEKTTSSITTPGQQPINTNKNKHTEDIGRGDIEPEETPLETVVEPYIKSQVLEPSSLNKEAQKPEEGEDTGNKLLVTHLFEQENINENQLELFSTSQSRETTTKASVQMSTTLKSIPDHQPSTQPILDVIDLNNNTVPELQELPHQQTLQKVEIPDDIQQQNVDQQFEDLSQIQSSWTPTNSFPQEYNQQNVEQQFVDFEQHESMQNQDLQDFGQQIQSSLPAFRDVQKKGAEEENPSQTQVPVLLIPSNEQTLQHTPNSRDTIANPSQVAEPIHASRNIDIESKNQNLVDNQDIGNSKSQDIQTPVETSSEKPGFWKSVGSKLSSAKNKVYSWFSSS